MPLAARAAPAPDPLELVGHAGQVARRFELGRRSGSGDLGGGHGLSNHASVSAARMLDKPRAPASSARPSPATLRKVLDPRYGAWHKVGTPDLRGKERGNMATTKQPGHFTEAGTRKFQANGPVEWTAAFRAAAGKDQALGDGIRAALAYAALHREQFVTWAKGHTDAWERALSAPVKRKAPAPGKGKGKGKGRARKPKQLELAGAEVKA